MSLSLSLHLAVSQFNFICPTDQGVGTGAYGMEISLTTSSLMGSDRPGSSTEESFKIQIVQNLLKPPGFYDIFKTLHILFESRT